LDRRAGEAAGQGDCPSPGGAVCTLRARLRAGCPAARAQATSKIFTYTGAEQTFTVPAGIFSVEVLAVGGRGGNASKPGGAAAQVSGELSVTPGETLYVEVGGNGGEGGPDQNAGGFNGGGEGAGGGGGASDVRTSPRASGLGPDTRLLVAGGGGGGGKTGAAIAGAGGGAGQGGEASSAGNGGGGAGTASSGGKGGGLGVGDPSCAPGSEGQLGVGGNAGIPNEHVSFFPGGGGGGGGYGGGGGASACSNGGGGGGGGSSLVPAGGSVGLTSSEPQVQISYTHIRTGPTGPTGATGPAGPAGPQGPTGPAGPRGPAGKIVCRDTAFAKATCQLLFPAGSYTIQGNATTASYSLTRKGRRYASGRVSVHRGQPIRVRLQTGHMPYGRYTLTITISQGHRTQTLLKRTVLIA
jgi:Glycine rich protein